MKGRALTPEQKRSIIERLYAAWLSMPEQRLGQLIENSLSDRENRKSPKKADLFFVEDEYLAEEIETFVKRFVVKK